jgi:hypothetical protein
MLFVCSQARHAVDFQSVRRAGLVSRVGGILSAQRAAVLAVADSYAVPDGSASHLVVVSFVNSAEEMVLHLFLTLESASFARSGQRNCWRATFYTTGMEHSPTSATGTGWERTPWRATQRAGLDALMRVTITQ